MPGIPDAVLSAGAVGIFAFSLLGLMGYIMKTQQTFIHNHISTGTKALIELKASIDRLADKL